MIIDCGMQVAAKTRGILFFVAVVAATVFFSYFNSRSTEVRLMTYNVRNAIGTDGVTDYGRVASVISHYDPDVVALQELDSMTRRSGGRDLLACLSAATGMKATWARAIAFDGGSYGIGVLSRETPLSVRVVPLPGSEEERRLLVVEFRDYVFACTHLSLDAGDRLASAGLIASAASGWEKPFFVAGDWNARPGDPFVAAMEADFEILSDPSCPTWPADAPSECLDYVAVMRGAARRLRVVDAAVCGEPVASDHRPVVVTVDFAADASRYMAWDCSLLFMVVYLNPILDCHHQGFRSMAGYNLLLCSRI